MLVLDVVPASEGRGQKVTVPQRVEGRDVCETLGCGRRHLHKSLMEPHLGAAAAAPAPAARLAAALDLHHPIVVVLLLVFGPHLQVHPLVPQPPSLPCPRPRPLPSVPLPPQHPRQGLPLVRAELQPAQARHGALKLGQRLVGRLVQPVHPLQLRLVHLGAFLPILLPFFSLGGGAGAGGG